MHYQQHLLLLKLLKKGKVKTNPADDTVDELVTSETDDNLGSETHDTPTDVKTTPMTVKEFGIQRMYEPKAKKLLLKITEHFNNLTRNASE